MFCHHFQTPYSPKPHANQNQVNVEHARVGGINVVFFFRGIWVKLTYSHHEHGKIIKNRPQNQRPLECSIWALGPS